MKLKRLVLFDIDGTLLWPDGAGTASMRAALEQIYGTAGPIDTCRFGGYTDRHIVGTLMRQAGLSAQQIWSQFEQLGPVMETALREAIHANQHDIRSCPGAIEMVDVLTIRKDVVLGLVTGNLRQTAPVKLSAAGFDPSVFQVGAYGDEAEARAELPPKAIERARQLTGVSFRGAQTVIIGDTPNDVLCGRDVGARSIAVMTGWVERPTLEAHSPDYIFDDLSNTRQVLDAIMTPVSED
jgi:phosphoglycolate phosphatase-like HAD superfamily hydrolase